MGTLPMVARPTSRQEFDFDQKDKHGLPNARASRCLVEVELEVVSPDPRRRRHSR
jgi:hypothetical protein